MDSTRRGFLGTNLVVVASVVVAVEVGPVMVMMGLVRLAACSVTVPWIFQALSTREQKI